jgi:hypothetical protein
MMNTDKHKTEKASVAPESDAFSDKPYDAQKSVRDAWQRAADKHSEEYANDIFPQGKPELPQSYAAQVQAGNDPEWVGNGLRFETRKAAEAYALDLQWRWTAVRGYRVVRSKDAVNNWDWS